jgi:hypothetical protein
MDDLASRLANLRQGIHAGPVREAVIGQNDVVLKVPEVIEKFFRRADDMRAALETGPLQFVKVEFRVGRGVLDHQHSKRRGHIPCRDMGETRGSLAHPDFSTRPAGAWRRSPWSGKKSSANMKCRKCSIQFPISHAAAAVGVHAGTIFHKDAGADFR